MRIAGVALGQLAPVTQDVTASSLVSGNWSFTSRWELVDEHGRTIKTEKYRPNAKS